MLFSSPLQYHHSNTNGDISCLFTSDLETQRMPSCTKIACMKRPLTHAYEIPSLIDRSRRLQKGVE